KPVMSTAAVMTFVDASQLNVTLPVGMCASVTLTGRAVAALDDVVLVVFAVLEEELFDDEEHAPSTKQPTTAKTTSDDRRYIWASFRSNRRNSTTGAVDPTATRSPYIAHLGRIRQALLRSTSGKPDSRAGVTGVAGLAAYSATKAAVIARTQSIAAESSTGASALVVVPPSVDTD